VKLTTERKPGSLVELNITADDQEFQEALDKAISKQARNLQIPGFRKGKAPRHMVERYYGREAFLRDAADEVMDRLYREALEQEDIRPVGEPSVEIVELEPVNFIVQVPVYPTIELGDYSSVRAEPADASVSDEDVQEVVNRLQMQQSGWVEVTDRKPQEGDQVTIDYSVKEGDKDFQEPITDAVWVLGETNLLPQLQDKIEELSVGDTESFDLVFEEDDETADPQIRGKQLTYSVTLKALKTRDLKPVDDEFAKTVAGAESVEDLMQQIRDDIHQGKTTEMRTTVLNSIVDQISELTELDLPEAMIDDEVEHQLGHRKQELEQQGMQWEQMLRMSNTTDEDVKADMRPDAAKRLKNSMILQEIARTENIEISDEEIDAEIDRVAGADLNADSADEETRERAKRLREVYNSDYFRNVLRNDMFERKLTDRLIEIATEGRGAVINGWVQPEVEATATESDAAADEEASTDESAPAETEEAAAEATADE
jgi:trigger factor